MRAGKTKVICRVPLVDNDVSQPQALLARYAPLGLATYLPRGRAPWKYLPLMQEQAGITRLHLGMHVGRKTFATLKIYQGVPRSQVMMATGHQTDANFNRYLGIDEKQLGARLEKCLYSGLKRVWVGINKKKVAPPGDSIIALISSKRHFSSKTGAKTGA